MKLIKPAMIIFAVFIVIALAIGIAQTFFDWTYPTELTAVNFVVIVVLLVNCAITIVSLIFGQKFQVKKLGMYLLHFGLVLFIVGSVIYSFTGREALTSIPVNNSVAYHTVQTADGQNWELGFSIGVDKFEISYYDPTYTIFKMNADNGPKAVSGEIRLKNGKYDFGEYGVFNLDDLVVTNSSGDKSMQTKTLDYDNGIVAMPNMTVSKYTAHVTIIQDGKQTQKELVVNYPVRANGVKIYLMGYNESTKSATVMFKRDVAEPISTAGLVITILATFYHCLVYPILINRGKSKSQSEVAA